MYLPDELETYESVLGAGETHTRKTFPAKGNSILERQISTQITKKP